MVQYFLILLATACLTSAYPKEGPAENNNQQYQQRPVFVLLDQTLQDQLYAQQIQNEVRVKAPLQEIQQPRIQELQQPRIQEQPQLEQQQIYAPGGFQYGDPQLQYPGYNQQAFPRIQPSILLYGAGGQGQPILINPGNPPGNFLVPQQPGVVYRNNPQNPVFVGGYPNPKPAHIPPIEKDAEEIPTNPANIPPFQSKPSESKPEKLETFTEDNFASFPKPAGEAGGLDEVDRRQPPQQVPNNNNLKPGQRFFILNGQPLYQNYPLNYPEIPNFGFQQIEQPFQQLQSEPREEEFNNYRIPVQTVLLRNSGPVEQPQNIAQNAQSAPQQLFPSFNQQNIPQESYFRTSLPTGVSDINSGIPIGQFRFSSPNGPYFPSQDEIDNDSVVINANFGDSSLSDAVATQPDPTVPAEKSPEPGTAQAAPGAIALAGPGGIAGAAPRGTALAGKGGLAVSSPQATAIAGTKKEEKAEKADKEKPDKQERKTTRKPKN
ncbi:uncharacterized protein [Diabrotica undecimpunctata]|uniref:uncharacterized protein n=1 Tax=Diabrotica undecimpunctata TaxID=50387 RepID=UPI003B63FA3E